MSRPEPNIIVTGTPGVGKTSHAQLLTQRNPALHHLDINAIVKQHSIGEANADDPTTKDVDEDRLLDVIENDLEDGGQVIDWHACDLFPPRLIDLVCVVRCENGKLYDRLKARGYKEEKLQENLDCEIMEVLMQEAREAFDEGQIVELRSEEADAIEANVERIEEWYKNWKKDNGGESSEVKAKGNSAEGGKGQEAKDEDNPMFLHG